MTYHRGFGQADHTPLPEGYTFTLEETGVTPTTTTTSTSTSRPTTTPAPTGGKTGTSTTSSSGGKSGASWAPQPAGTPITSAAYAAGPPSSGAPHWLPWAIGGGVAVIGLGLILAARN